jgi:tetratricopeptide (TPR) repeat protein
VIRRRSQALFLAIICAAFGVLPARASSRDRQWVQSMAAGQIAFEAGRYAQAERLLKYALVRAERFGPRDMRLPSTLNRLAQVYHDQGEFSKAEPLYKRSLALVEKNLGPAHPDVAANLNNLATLYRDEGQFEHAEVLYRRSLGIVRKAQGPESQDVAITLNNLAELYADEGKYDAAEPLYQESLKICEKTQGASDMSVAISLNNLGALYDNEKKYPEAIEAYKHALAIKEINLGASDPSIALTLSNLGKVYVEARQYDEAQPVLYSALTILHWPLEVPNNPVAGRALDHLATFYRDTGNDVLADFYYKKAMEITRKTQGARSPNLASTMRDYAVMLRQANRPDEAAKMDAGAQAIEAHSGEAPPAPRGHALRERKTAVNARHPVRHVSKHPVARRRSARVKAPTPKAHKPLKSN